MPDEREQIAVDEETDAAELETEEPEPEEEIAFNESRPASTANAASADQADNPELTRYENLLRRELYDFARCTVTVTLQLLPDDGDPAGRPVVGCAGPRLRAEPALHAAGRNRAAGRVHQRTRPARAWHR